MDSCGISCNGFSRGNVSSHDGSGANYCVWTNPYSGKNNRTSSNKSELTHYYLTGKSCSGRDMDTIAEDAIMVDGCLCIDNDRLAEVGAGTYCTHGQNMTPVVYECVFSDEGS